MSEPVAAEVFRLPPQITFANIVPLRNDGERFIREDGQRPVFSLAELEVSNSTAVALLLGWFRRAQRLGKPVVFTDVPEDLLNIIRVCGLLDVLPLQAEPLEAG